MKIVYPKKDGFTIDVYDAVWLQQFITPNFRLTRKYLSVIHMLALEQAGIEQDMSRQAMADRIGLSKANFNNRASYLRKKGIIGKNSEVHPLIINFICLRQGERMQVELVRKEEINTAPRNHKKADKLPQMSLFGT